jgi:dihydrofolate reductase
MSREVFLIAAHNRGGYIGKGGSLMYKLPADIANFKVLTTGSPVIMCTETFDRFAGPLEGCLNIIVTSSSRKMIEINEKYDKHPNVKVIYEIENAIKLANKWKPEKEVLTNRTYIIGGEKIYEAGMEYASGAILTMIEDDKVGDERFPMNTFNESFEEIDQLEEITTNGYEIEITQYARSDYSKAAFGLLWESAGDREGTIVTLGKNGIRFRLSKVDSVTTTKGAPIVTVHVGNKAHSFRFGSARSANVAFNQLDEMLNGV